MIVKPHTPPVELRILQAKLNRLVEGHPQYENISIDCYKRASGYFGEKSLSYYMDFLDSKTTAILHGLRLPYKNHFFQMDTLILFTSFSLVIETKNWAGAIHVQETGEIIRTYNDLETAFPCPVQQVKHQCWQLTEWAKINKVTMPPIHYVAVFTNQKMIIQESKHLSPLLIRSSYLLDHIRKLESSSNKTTVTALLIIDLIKLATFLKHSHQDLDLQESSIGKYNLKRGDIYQGVQCPKCQQFSMNRLKRTWECPSCGMTSQTAHVQAIKEYVLLFGRFATSTEIREFLKVEEFGVVRRILKNLGITRKKHSQNVRFDLLESEELRKRIYH